jgi:hypothetical protein
MKRFSSQNKRSFDRHKKTQDLSFNSFSFTDNVTNNKILLREAKEQYPHSQPAATPPYQARQSQVTQQEIHNLTNCIALLKTTKLFQMDSLRSKLFKSAHHSRQASQIPDEDLSQTKQGLKKILETSIHELNRK